MNKAVTGIFVLIGTVIAYGIPVPRELNALKILGAFGFLAGAIVGTHLASCRAAVQTSLSLLLLIVGGASLVGYLVIVEQGAAEIGDIFLLAVLLCAGFFSFGLLLRLYTKHLSADSMPSR